jgi:hypothetical protein
MDIFVFCDEQINSIIVNFIKKYLLQDKNGKSCKTKIQKVAIGNSIKLQNPLQA